jgi:hypothetical protein
MGASQVKTEKGRTTQKQYALFTRSVYKSCDAPGLFDFDLRSSGLDLLLDLFRFLFGDSFFDRLGGTLH